MPMQVSIVNNSNSNISTSNTDKLLLYYQSVSTRGEIFTGDISSYQDYILHYDHDSNVERLLNYNKYNLLIHRVTDIGSSEIYIDNIGDCYDYLNYQPISLVDLILNDTNGYYLADDFWIILDFNFRTEDHSGKNPYIESSPISFVFGGIDSDIEKIVNAAQYKFTSRNITPKQLVETIIESLDNNLHNKINEVDNIVGLYTKINETTIRLVNNCGIVSNYNIFKINKLPIDQYSVTKNYALHISNSANQNIGIIFNYDKYVNKFIIIYKLYDENDELIYSTDTMVSELTNLTIDKNLTIELGSLYNLFFDNVLDQNSNVINKEFRLYRKKVYSTNQLYYDKLSELDEINSTIDIAIDPTVVDSNNVNYNSNEWARELLYYKPTAVVLTSDNYYNNSNIASFNPRYYTIRNSTTRLPSYYLFLAMYPDRYIELVDQISFIDNYDYIRNNGINISKTDYGYEIDNPSTVRSLNAMISIAHTSRLIINRTYSTINEAINYISSIPNCSILSYTNSNTNATIHISLLVDDVKRELNIEVTLNG